MTNTEEQTSVEQAVDAVLADAPEPMVEPKSKRTRKKKVPEISDADIAEFKAWKEAKKHQPEVEVVEREDQALYDAWKEESRVVKGTFRCHEPRGGSVKFVFRKYKWDPVKTYFLEDGKEYELPLSVARHLNQNCNYGVHSQVMDSQGNPTIDRSGKVVSRMNFESLQYS